MFNSYIENTLVLDVEKCNGCAMCITVCPHNVFSIIDHRAMITKSSDCMECGACKRNCASGAIRVHNGVGCAAAMISAALRGKKEVSCC